MAAQADHHKVGKGALVLVQLVGCSGVGSSLLCFVLSFEGVPSRVLPFLFWSVVWLVGNMFCFGWL